MTTVTCNHTQTSIEEALSSAEYGDSCRRLEPSRKAAATEATRHSRPRSGTVPPQRPRHRVHPNHR